MCEDQSNPSPMLTSRFSTPTLGSLGVLIITRPIPQVRDRKPDSLSGLIKKSELKCGLVRVEIQGHLRAPSQCQAK